MKGEAFTKPSVPMIYVLLTLQQGAERGLQRDALLKDTGITPAQLEDPSGYVPLLAYGYIVYRLVKWGKDGSVGYEFGLRANLSAQGVPGFGMMNSRNLLEASAFGLDYFSKLRAPGFVIRRFVEGDDAVIDVSEAVSFGRMRQYAFDVVIVTMTHIAKQFVKAEDLEMWFDTAEPEYYARYRHLLPRAKFSTGVNQLRCPKSYLQQPLESANPITHRLVVEQCKREIEVVSGPEVVSRVRAALAATQGGYPDLEAIASSLAMSSRTLKRRLQEHDFTFRQLLDEVRCRDAIRLLQGTALTVAEVADRLGYTAPGNFTRAFRKWTGKSPAEFRQGGASNVPALHGREPR